MALCASRGSQAPGAPRSLASSVWSRSHADQRQMRCRPSLRALVVLLVLCLGANVVSRPTAASHPLAGASLASRSTGMASPDESSPFGVNLHLSLRYYRGDELANPADQAMDLAKAAGVAWVREEFAWERIQPNPHSSQPSSGEASTTSTAAGGATTMTRGFAGREPPAATSSA